jgi:uncharacterized protein YbjT (DUF2867 family)
MKTALVVGATGLIGGQLLELLKDDVYYEKVLVLSRKPMSIAGKCENRVVNFDELEDAFQDIRDADVFCCLGTTMKVARSKEAFIKVDYTYPLTVAKLSKQQGAKQYLLVSALGANKNSSVFYNTVKGEVEQAIEYVGFGAYHIFRPSLLLGERREARSGEDAAKVFFKLFGFLVPAKWKGIEGRKVAKAMLHFAKGSKQGTSIHESAEMQQF